jgi:hypothetical protein
LGFCLLSFIFSPNISRILYYASAG